MKYALTTLVVLAAIAGVWYFVAPPDIAPTDVKGTITGTTMYPSEEIPAQVVCAEVKDNPATTFCTTTKGDLQMSDNTKFHIKVPPGTYHVYATLKDPAELGGELGGHKAYYTEFVRCGLNYECKNHEKISITVGPAQSVSDVQPYDWYQ